MDVKKILESHKKIKDRIYVNITEIQQLRSITDDLLENSQTARNDKEIVQKILDVDKRLNVQYDYYVELQSKIEKMVSSLDNEAEQIAIKLRYILHEPMQSIADEMSYSSRHVKRLLSHGIEVLQERYAEVELKDINI